MEKFDFKQKLANLERMKSTLPQKIANATMLYFRHAFDSAEWDGRAWKTVKRTLKKGGSSRNQSKPLVQSSALRTALRRSLVVVNFRLIQFKITDIPYAEIQNQGGVIHKAAKSGHVLHFNKKGRFAKPHKAKYGQKADIGAHSITIPPRTFMPLPNVEQPKDLTKLQLYMITKEVNKVFGI